LKMAKNQVVFILGPPGSGKGTQCGKLVEKYGYVHLSAGDLLRAERKSGSAEGATINKIIDSGALVPSHITVGLLKKAMESSPATLFLIDGFPRGQENVDAWKNVMGDSVELKFVLFLVASDKVCVERCISRGATSGRGDDNAEVLKKRLETYATQTKPVLDAYEAAGYIRKVDSGRDVDVVFADVCKVCDAAIDTAGSNSDDDAQVSKDGSSAFPSFAPTTMLYVLAFAALAVGISRALNK